MSVKIISRVATLCVTVFLSLVCGAVAAETMPLNLTEGVTPTSKQVYDLHMIILYIVTAIGVVVFSIMCWSIFHHRKSRGAVAADFSHSTFAEVTWTIIPILILVAMAIPATKTLIFMEQTGDSEMTIKVTGYQWKWRYDYLEEDISFYSTLSQDSNIARQRNSNVDPNTVENYLLDVDNPVVVPVNTKIRILTTAADVNHAWWVPALGWKRDAIPGFINDNWTYIEEPGVYRGQCAELCGKDHGFMPIVVNAVSKEDYAAWVSEMKGDDTGGMVKAAMATEEAAVITTEAAPAEAAEEVVEEVVAMAEAGAEMSKDDLLAKGKDLYAVHCVACHMAEGQGVEGLFPALDGSAIVNGPKADMINLILNGKNLMPAFRDQLKDAELAAIMTHERNSWGNTAKDMISAADVAAAR